jgi:hypothetical protein
MVSLLPCLPPHLHAKGDSELLSERLHNIMFYRMSLSSNVISATYKQWNLGQVSILFMSESPIHNGMVTITYLMVLLLELIGLMLEQSTHGTLSALIINERIFLLLTHV